MSVSRHHPLPPTSSLPSLRSLDTLTENQISAALRNLNALYCPLPRSCDFQSRFKARKQPRSVASTPADSGYATPADSGYASDNEGGPEHTDDEDDTLNALRADAYERTFATRWLTGFIARAEELNHIPEDSLERAIDDAASVLASFSDRAGENDEEDLTLIRDFSFELKNVPSPAPEKIQVRINDAPLSGADHTDVGLQSWGASIVFSDLICSSPARFGLTQRILGSSPRIVELGAGTGLISLMLANLLPHLDLASATVIATDYHPAVLENLRLNVTSNFPSKTPAPVQTCLLDWALPSSEPPLDAPADLLVAADVVYAPEHAVWLRNCAAHYLTPDGVFWLIFTVRTTGKFEGIGDTIERAFAADDSPKTEDGRVLKIVDVEKLEKRRGVGRGDETGYKLFRISWV
ncbi:methyltransferase [Pseudomassariella vexata]|uniref:Methyltransferase n=1 Tax=Pseudomassariella vexata TaxID=1141098 RepID=A0A1Y2DEN2_9PEZI|nr:methyltransferase [Pseudomassariella vexata]ORY57743.1 methyltransferase [Pseudomassariella vexata]